MRLGMAKRERWETYTNEQGEDADDVGEYEHAVEPAAHVRRGEEGEHVDGDEGDPAVDYRGPHSGLAECPGEQPFVD